jgi:hypothetical protein
MLAAPCPAHRIDSYAGTGIGQFVLYCPSGSSAVGGWILTAAYNGTVYDTVNPGGASACSPLFLDFATFAMQSSSGTDYNIVTVGP